MDADELLEHLDLSIVRLPLFWEQHEEAAEPLFLWHYRGRAVEHKQRFWLGVAHRRRDIHVRGNWLNQNPFISTLADLPRLDHDFMLLSDERIDELQALQTVNIESRKVIVPWAVTEQMSEQVPQFTLRNIARLEKDDSVERGIRLDYAEAPLANAEREIQAVRDHEHERPEFVPSFSAPLFEDFRVFLEEILYLCPWSEMPTEKRMPEESSLWHPAQSRAQLTRELLDKRGKIFVFGHQGGPLELLKEKPKVVYTAKEPAASQGPPRSYGPLPDGVAPQRSYGPTPDGGDDGGRMG